MTSLNGTIYQLCSLDRIADREGVTGPTRQGRIGCCTYLLLLFFKTIKSRITLVPSVIEFVIELVIVARLLTKMKSAAN